MRPCKREEARARSHNGGSVNRAPGLMLLILRLPAEYESALLEADVSAATQERAMVFKCEYLGRAIPD